MTAAPTGPVRVKAPALRAGFAARVVRAAMLDPPVYEEVEADATATPQALAVVLLASVAAGIGGAGMLSPGGMAARALIAVVTWVVWAIIITHIGGRILPEPQTRVDTRELLRTLGFAAAPGIIQVLGVMAPLRRSLVFVAWIWMLAAMVLAVRQALDYTSTGRAVLVCVLGALAAFSIMVLLGFALSAPVW